MRVPAVLFAIVVSSGCAGARPAPDSDLLGQDLSIRPLTEHTLLVTALAPSGPYANYPSNSLIALGFGEAALIDTPWTVEQTERLLRWAGKALRVPVRRAVVTHAHDDRMGGVPALKAAGIEVWGNALTSQLAPLAGLAPPDQVFIEPKVFDLGGVWIEAFYPGAGHSPDNAVAFVSPDRTLFGGCLVKASAAQDLGNTKEADLASWPASLGRVLERYPNPSVVVPGHGTPGGLELLDHTSRLLEEDARRREAEPPAQDR